MKIGIDIIETSRFKKIKDKTGRLNTIFTQQELSFLQKKDFDEEYLAKIFSIKEAASKALGTGFSQGVSPTNIDVDISLYNPKVTLTGKAKTLFQSQNFNTIEISVVSKNSSLAICILC